MSDRWTSPDPRGPRAGVSARAFRPSPRHPAADDGYGPVDARDDDPADVASRTHAPHSDSVYPTTRGRSRGSAGSDLLYDEPSPHTRYAAGDLPNRQRRRDRNHDIDWQVSPDDRYDDEWPTTVRFVDEDDSDYIVLDLLTGHERRVPKQRLALEIFPATRHYPPRGGRLLRLSGYAMIGALFGGVIGIVLGCAVLLVTLARLAAFAWRAQAWRNRQAQGANQRRQRRQRIPLPLAATSERLRLLTALGQSLLAIALAVAELSLAMTFLR